MPHEQLPINEDLFKGNEWVLPTDIGLVEPAEENFSKRLTEAGWNEDEAYPLQLGFREALINAMVHGNLEVESDKNIPTGRKALDKQRENPTDKKVYVNLDITPNHILVKIKDEGKGFDWKSVTDPTSPDELLKSSGRGDQFMRLFDSVVRNDKGNEVTMTKNRN